MSPSPSRPASVDGHPLARKTVLFGPAVLVLTLLLTGCTSTRITPLPRPASESQGEVIIFREYAFAAGGVSLKVGTGAGVFAILETSEKASARFPAGTHEIFVQAQSAEPTRVRFEIAKGEVVCLRTSSSPSTYVKVLVPVSLMLTGYHFYLDRVSCPKPDVLAKYKDVEVGYQ